MRGSGFGHASFYLTSMGFAPWFPAALILLGLLAIGGWVQSILLTRGRLHQKEKELAAARKELQERSAALAVAEGEVERLRGVPKSELLPMLKLAHQQRSPLAAIQNALDMLLQGYAKNDPGLQDEMLSLARDRAATMLERVNDFLRLGSVRHSEIERKLQPVQLLDVVQRLAPEQRVRARWGAVDLHLDVPDSLPPVRATYEDMEHLLSNLVNNAIKYTNPGGKVTVSLREQDGQVVGSVEDTGIGIAPEDLPRIFDEFYRAERAKGMALGTGLGLAIVKRVIDLYNGHLHVESEPGKGSKFTFTFPTAMLAPGEDSVKTFSGLQAEVVRKGLCSQCGGCVAACSAGSLNVLGWGKDGLPCYADEGGCLACGTCYLICPRTRDLDTEVRRKYGWKPPIGAYRAVISARATETVVRETSADGGVTASLLMYMIENYLIQGAIVTQKTTAFSCQPLFATAREELLDVGTPDHGPSCFEELDRYTTYAPIVSAVKALEDRQFNCVAMVGNPCQVNAVRKMQCLGIQDAQVVGYAIGSFCMGTLSFDASGRRELEDRLRINLADVCAQSAKEDARFSLSNGTAIHVPFEQLDGVLRPACLACTEFGNDYADIAVGGLGSPDGYATILIRTEKGERAYHGALHQGYIEEREFGGLSESRIERTKMLTSVVSLARRKQERGEARLRESGIGEDRRVQSVKRSAA